MSGLSRRRLLSAAAGIAAGAALPVGAGAAVALAGEGEPGRVLRSAVPLPRPYEVALPVPPVLKPVRTDATTDYYEITQRVARARILPGRDTEIWGYDGMFPGPTLVSRSGRRTVVRHRTELPRPVVVHLHGGHTPSVSDGYPLDELWPPGSRPPPAMAGMGAEPDAVVGHRVYTYPMDQRAATLWYHDHRMGFTGASVWRGLAGMHLVRDDEEDALPLPAGDRDVPLMITDRSFGADGGFHYPSADLSLRRPGVTEPYMNGVLGDVILVNGAPWPVLAADRARYRFRLLNASNARRYRLALDPPPPGGHGFVQVGGDGGLLARPVPHDAIDLAPAERFDVVVDLARYPPGARVRLVNRLGRGLAAEVLRLDVGTARTADPSAVPARLSHIERLDPRRSTVTREFRFQANGPLWTINGVPYRPGHPLAVSRLGEVEIWRFITDLHHPVHVHLNQFQVLSRNGTAPGPYDAGWKDTVDLHPAEAVEVAVRFTDYRGRYLIHCHNLEHEDMAMMAEFRTD